MPAYYFEINPIQEQWHQFKAHELAGQMFDNKYDLAMAIINGMEARSIKGGYVLEHFIFNFA
ncbi:hypothetical protein [Nostoc mirabile]|uniref:hypothetical protein n=1 Tax=Nostoc mirabile TaxID=2907820 RepID=UPI001E3DBEDF|nr:hypothetical protein [Nostoc mirabile]